MRYFLPILLLVIFLSSCGGGLRIEKRHYRNGFYISTHKKQEKQDAGQPQAEDINRDLVFMETGQEIAEPVCGDTLPDMAEEDDALITKSVAVVPVIQPELMPQDSAKKETPRRKFLKYDGPEEARWATIMHWIGWPMVAVAILGMILAFIIPGAFPLVLIFSPLFTVGVILEAIVLVKSIFASNKYQSQPTIAAQFNKLERQITITALVIAGIYILYVATVLILLIRGYL